VEQRSTQVAGEPAGRDATAEALGYAWEHWARRRRAPVLFESSAWVEHRFEPGLPGALASLSERQRLAVVLVHGFGYTLREVAELTGVKLTTVQNHLERGLARLRAQLGVSDGD
jgi:RNA polymerase sigma factor (sigma-70 family)